MFAIRHRIWLVTGVLSLAWISAACGQPSSPSSAVSPGSTATSCLIPGGPGEPNWDSLSPGDSASSIDQAATQLSFRPRTPEGWGNPSKILVVPSASEAAGTQRTIEVRFDHQSYGRVWVVEGPWEGASDYGLYAQEVAEQSAKVPCGPTAEATAIRKSIPAILYHSIDKSQWNLHWVEGTIEFRIIGPHLTRDQVLAIANGPWS